MQLYRVVILDRNYSNHMFYHVEDNNKREIDIDLVPIMKDIRPLDHKMFMDDIFEFSPEKSQIGNDSLNTLSSPTSKNSLYESSCTSKSSGIPAIDLSSL